MQEQLKKVSSGQAIVDVIGIGYAGHPLSMPDAREIKFIGCDTQLINNLVQRIHATVFRNLMKRNPVLVDCRNVFAFPPLGTLHVGFGMRGSAGTDTASTLV